MRIVIVSATAVIAQHCILRWASADSHDFVLVGRSQERLDAVLTDLRIRFPNSGFSGAIVDFKSSESIADLASAVSKKPMDIVLVAQGSLTKQQKVSSDLGYLQSELELNAVSVALFLEAFAGIFEKQGKGTLGVIGSVAGDRGRAYNYSYGASKSLIETYTQGLQQRFAKSNVSVCLIKPGPTATPMTDGHSGRMAPPESVANVIVAGLARRRRVIYAPRIWGLVMVTVRLIPFWLFKNLKF